MAPFQTKHFNCAICDCCNGHGKVDHPAFSNGITSSEWAEMADDWDAESETNAQDRYLAGAYDVVCENCSGAGKVKVPDFKRMPRDERKAYIQFLREEREEFEFQQTCRAELEAERRIGA